MPIDKEFRVIDGDMAVSMCEHGFNVFDVSNRKISSLDDFDFESDNDTYYAPAAEIEQENALCSVVVGLDVLNALARNEARETESILTGISLADYAVEQYENGDCKYQWHDGKSEWENIADSILSGDTEYIHAWLNDFPENLPYFEGNQGVSISEHRDALTQYEQTYRPNIDDLSRKVSAEYDAFIEDMKKQPPEVIIDAAYEITWKDAINVFIENEDVHLSSKQLKALLSSQNSLDEIFEEWVHNGDLHTYSDLQIALDVTANNILTALDRQLSVLPEEKSEHHEKATVLVDGEIKELPVILDSQGADITGDFLKETVDNVSAYYEQREAEENDPVWKDGAEFEDYPSTGMIARLPPFEVEKEIRFNLDTNRVEMSQAAFKWFEQYAPKHNKVSVLENQLLAHIRATDKLSEYEFVDTYRGSGDPTNLDEAADRKSEWLQDFAKEHSIAKVADEKSRKPSLSERIDKARAENPRTDAPKHDKQQTKNNVQEM